jgi:hypothetical protein
MFKVIEKATKIQYLVYSVEIQQGETRFLIYKDSQWQWIPDSEFIPLNSLK